MKVAIAHDELDARNCLSFVDINLANNALCAGFLLDAHH